MESRSSFPVEQLSPLVQLAWERAAAPRDLPEGWSICPADPGEVVEVFPLRVKAGWKLRAYQLRMGGNANGFVWLLPEGVEMPDPNAPGIWWGTRIIISPFVRLPLDNPRPPGGVWDFRPAIEGDGSPFSYVCHSLLARVLADFRSRWHGEVWRSVDMLAKAADVTEDGESITVRLYCYTRLGCEGTFTVVDSYQRGSYAFDWKHEDVVVTGGGFVH